jgi:hypothetical protein
MLIETMGFDLGDKVRDKVTGIEGVLTGFTQWLTGCARANIARGLDKDGKLFESHGCDVTTLEVIEKGAVKSNITTNGGPAPNPPPRTP